MWTFWTCITVCWSFSHRGRASGHQHSAFQTYFMKIDNVYFLSRNIAFTKSWTCSLNLEAMQSKQMAIALPTWRERIFTTKIRAVSWMSSIMAEAAFSDNLFCFLVGGKLTPSFLAIFRKGNTYLLYACYPWLLAGNRNPLPFYHCYIPPFHLSGPDL